jgi:hypothetical protein
MFGTTKKRKAKKKIRGFEQSPAHQSQKRLLQQTQVYLMHNIPFFWLNKFGITDYSKARRRNVSETTPGYVFYIFAPRLEFGWHLEQFIHRLYRFQNIHFWTGSGRTEWFLVFSPATGILFAFGCNYFSIQPDWRLYVLAFFTPFVWWDGFLWLLIFSLGRLVIWVTLGMSIIYAITHI